MPLVQCSGIRLTDDHLAEMVDGWEVVGVARADVRDVTLGRRLRAPHPILPFVLGSALTAAGIPPAIHLVNMFRHGGLGVKLEAWLMMFAVLGLSLVVDAFKRGFVLDVKTDRGVRRLLFTGKPTPSELDAFVDVLERSWNVRVTREGRPVVDA